MHSLRQAETSELKQILRNYHEHPEELVKQAYRELDARGMLQSVIKQLRKELRSGEMQLPEESPEPFRDFNPSNPVMMRIGSTQQVIFEQKLAQEGIPYHRQEGLDVIVPLVNYYFNDRDRARADELEIETHNYVRSLPPDQHKKTTKTALKAVFWIILFFGVFLLITLITKIL